MSHRRVQSNFTNPDINPCIEESQLSSKCLEEKLYDYKACAIFFENHKKCKKFWTMIRRTRLANGISPGMPGKAERDEILRLKKEGKSVFAAETSDKPT